MIVTEEEAKTKRCQEGYAASPGAALNPATDYVHQSFVVPSHHISHSLGSAAGLTATTAAPMTAPIMCLGTACMAWRWLGWRTKDDGVYYDAGEDNYSSDPDAVRVGYCGKAGKP